MFRLLTFSFFTACAISANSQTENARVRALIESSAPLKGSDNLNTGTYLSMEDVRHGAIPGLKGVQVRLEQPLCNGQSGSLLLVNETGESWNYKVIDRKGPLVTQGATGYNRKIGNLLPGNYLIQFVHANGTSVVDNFSVKEGKVLEFEMAASNESNATESNVFDFKATALAGMEYEWDFGDGQITFEGNSVSHAYKQPGTYKVKCSIGNFDCRSEKSLDIIIHGPAILAEQKD